MSEHTDIEGVIEKMHTKSGTGKRGAWTKYLAIINGGWVNFGFDDPGYSEGQSVKVRCEEDQYGQQVKQHRLSDTQPAPGSPPASGGGGGGAAWGNASNVAASLLESLVSMDAMPITAATGKANKAKRFDEIMEIFDKLRVKLYRDSEDPSRVLDNVADYGDVETESPPALPNGTPPEPEQEQDDFEDDIPF